MRLRTVAIGVASVAWLLAMELSPSAQAPAPPAAVFGPSAAGAAAAGDGRRRPVTAPGPAAKPSAAYHPPTRGGVRRGDQAAVQRDLRRVSQLDRAGRRPRHGALQLSRVPDRGSGRAGSGSWRSSSPERCRRPDVERPEAEIKTLVAFLETEFARADASMTPRSRPRTARRLNRAEYTNTIRDLLAIDFRADKNFPTDDSGEGFDNIGDDPHRLAGADGEVPVGRGADRRAGDWPRASCRSRSRSSTACASRTCGGSIRATSRRRTASTSTPTTS